MLQGAEARLLPKKKGEKKRSLQSKKKIAEPAFGGGSFGGFKRQSASSKRR